MTPQEIVKQVQKLSVRQQREVLQALAESLDAATNNQLSEAEIAEQLFAQGVIREIPADWNASAADFEPLVIKGKPLSETILEDRE